MPLARRIPKAFARRHALDVMERHKRGQLNDEQAMKIALDAQRWARHKPKARAKVTSSGAA